MRLIANLLACGAFVAPLSAQLDDVAPGFTSSGLSASGELLSVAVSDGSYAELSEDELVLRAANGSVLRTLDSFPSPVTPLMVGLDPTESFLLYGIANEGTYRVDLDGSNETFLSPLTGSAVAWDGNDSVVLAVFGSPLFRWFVYRLEVDTGRVKRLAEVPGFFGTLTATTNGEIFVAYDGVWKSPPAPGWEVARFDAGVLTGSVVRTVAAAVPLVNGLEVVSALAVDPVDGRLFLGEQGDQPGENRIRTLRRGFGTPEQLVAIAAPERVRSLQVLPGAGEASFDAFQPASGARLVYGVSANASGGPVRRERLATRRPELLLEGPGTSGVGPFELSVRGGPAGGVAAVFYGPSALFDANETVLPLSPPVFVGLDFGTLVRVPGFLPLDANGDGSLFYTNGSGVTNAFAVQAVLLDGTGATVGSTSAAFL